MHRFPRVLFLSVFVSCSFYSSFLAFPQISYFVSCSFCSSFLAFPQISFDQFWGFPARSWLAASCVGLLAVPLLYLGAWPGVVGQGASDWTVSQIESPVVRQIDLHVRLGPEVCQIDPCSRLPDWVLCQVGQIGLSARLPDRGPGQIGSFSFPTTCGKAGSLASTRAPD